jgi:glutamate formiminotransferase
MMEKIVECVPNFSEGRREEVISGIRDSIQAVSGVFLLDRHTDADHNRTVLTFAGEPQAVAEAAFAAIRAAATHIDMDRHTGEHPRLGATDVVPFVPLRGTTLEDCIKLARDLGRRVGEELGIPVYLYEAAATRPDRVNLEDVRRGEYEALKAAIELDPERAPDFGPRKLGKAGATIIGARHPLIAFNVYLSSDDVSIAKKIAMAIRHSSGGLCYLKALGLFVDGRAQVSMNLTNYKQTPLARVVELIRCEAARYGTCVHHSELVGLIPEEALVEAARWYLQLDPFENDQILETRLQTALSSREAQMPPGME